MSIILKNNEITLKESLATIQNVNSQSCNLILFNHIFTFFITENNFKQFWNIYKDIRIKEYENVELLKELYFDQLIYMSDKIEACTLLEQMKMLVNIPFSKLLIVKYINFLESTEKFISASAEYEKLISYYQSDVDVWIDYVLFAKKYYTHFDSNFIDKIYTKAIKILSPEHGNLFLSKYTLIHL
ncbi:hypothetical protein A3Q56_05350 [Intoshia linei]|uniref:Suppressor of forked domain-containing protein n=1 Tax=Intoshia linei TaxID=1819745 RepID=A0A177B0G6_9BILA|nr:hypothetical protein A3Q56_05350 [Intoshia linei]